MWLRHWHLAHDPFFGSDTPYVTTSGHDEAIARLVATIESCQPVASLHAAEGLGKHRPRLQPAAAVATRGSGRKVCKDFGHRSTVQI